MHIQSDPACSRNTIMILFSIKDFKSFNQKSYAYILSKINISTITCPNCKKVHTLVFFGYYSRSIITNSGIVILDIQRVYCKHCHTTHALLPSSLVPYSQYPVYALKDIILEDEQRMMILFQISLQAVRRICSHYHVLWAQLLPNLWHRISLHLLVHFCFSSLIRQFMQMRSIKLFIWIYPST